MAVWTRGTGTLGIVSVEKLPCVAGVHKAHVLSIVLILVSTNEDELRATVYSDILDRKMWS